MMMNLKRRLEKIEEAVNGAAPEPPTRLYFPSDWSKEAKIESTELMVWREADALGLGDATEQERHERAVEMVESGEFDPPAGTAD